MVHIVGAKMKGVIFINPFLVTAQNVHQAERLKQEFNKMGVDIEIISDGYTRIAISGKGVSVDLQKPDFAIYLDKDKYLSQILEKNGFRFIIQRVLQTDICL